jgi:flagellar biosynthetic protein FliR
LAVPDLFPMKVEWLQAYLLVLVRVSSMIVFLPMFGAANMPRQVKVGLSALTAALIFPLLDTKAVSVDMDIMDMALLVAGEAMIGVATSFLINLMLSAVNIAGSFIDFQIGFGIVNVIDPTTGAQVSVTTQILNITTMLLLLSFNAHHMMLMGIADSFSIVPVGGFHAGEGFGDIFVNGLRAALTASAQIAAPVTVTLLIQQAALGLMARTVPQLNIFAVGFPFTIGIGLLTVSFSMPAFAMYVQRLMGQMSESMTLLFYAMR